MKEGALHIASVIIYITIGFYQFRSTTFILHCSSLSSGVAVQNKYTKEINRHNYHATQRSNRLNVLGIKSLQDAEKFDLLGQQLLIHNPQDDISIAC